MSTYYCLVAGLPDISLDDGKLSYSVSDFKAELYPDLSAQDRKLIDLFYLKFDNMAILKLLKNKDTVIEDKGNFSAEELLQLIEAVREGDTPDKKYPSYLVNFVSQYLQLHKMNYIVPMICWQHCIILMECHPIMLLLLLGLNLI